MIDDAECDRKLERLRGENQEAWEKAGIWHRLLRDQNCNFCREPLLSGTGPPCQHQKWLIKASEAGPKAFERLARLHRIKEAMKRVLNDTTRLEDAHDIARAALEENERIWEQMNDVADDKGRVEAEAERLREKYEAELGISVSLRSELDRLREEHHQELVRAYDDHAVTKARLHRIEDFVRSIADTVDLEPVSIAHEWQAGARAVLGEEA